MARILCGPSQLHLEGRGKLTLGKRDLEERHNAAAISFPARPI